jgi:hypothetical protein
MLLVSLLGCASPVIGTWMFTRQVTPNTGDECTTSLTHNFVGAYEPIQPGEDTAWESATTGEYSPELFFGRVEQADGGDAVLIIGTAILPGTRGKGGEWAFTWTGSDDANETDTHISGYQYVHDSSTSEKLVIAGDFGGGEFSGSHDTETSSTGSWTENDVWSPEAAAYVGESGQIPASSYLLRIDTNGAESAAYNAREAYDCGQSGCTMTRQQTCAYRYDLTAVMTTFDDDAAGWTEDASQEAGF